MNRESQLIDHTLLSPTATAAQVQELCDEAVEHDFWSVCISPCRVGLAADHLRDTDVRVCTVIGFPSGAHVSTVKAAETRQAVADGADEVDMVINIGAVKDGDWEQVKQDIAAVVDAAGEGVLVKVILETCLLDDEEIVQACQCARDAGAHFVKTSTGFSTGGASVHAVQLMRATVGESMGVKASGGIRSRETLETMVAAGASRIGASAGVALLGGAQ
ncbi:MAG: deoxyribose-phosphate aldolase [Cutibacterium sp.]|nr:deoxyribose-phosphate aldolase [Streptomyces sp. MAG02]MDU3272842.1 deoxyribose-phosphate aldolase [Cutibacterium sp.]